MRVESALVRASGKAALTRFGIDRVDHYNMAEASAYESEGRTFESFRARQHLAGIYRTKGYGVLRDLQGSFSLSRFASV